MRRCVWATLWCAAAWAVATSLLAADAMPANPPPPIAEEPSPSWPPPPGSYPQLAPRSATIGPAAATNSVPAAGGAGGSYNVDPAVAPAQSVFAPAANPPAQLAQPFSYGSLNAEPISANPLPAMPSGNPPPGRPPIIGIIPPEDELTRWYVQSEVLFLHRSNGSFNQPLVYDNTTGNPLVWTGDLGFHNWAPGAKLLLGYRFANQVAFEASYLGFQDWNANAGATSPGNLSTPGALGFFSDDYSQADAMRINYASRLHNFEANLVIPARRMAWLAGFRYLSWNETLQINSTSTFFGSPETSTYGVRSNNNLFGLQVGTRLAGNWRRLRFDVTPKLGLYVNSFSQRSQILDDGNTFVVRDTWVGYSNVAFVGDLPFSAAWQLTDHVALRVGYNLLFINGLALAPDQLDFDFHHHSGFEHNHDGGVTLQGFSTGLDIRW